MSSRSDRTRRALAGLAALSLVLVVGACSASATLSSPATPHAAPDTTARATSGAGEQGGGVAVTPGAPAIAPGVVTTGPATATGIATSGTAIAYPYYGGVPAVAPEHTIVVSGYGQATMAADGADRAKAQGKALAVAMADAREQADAIAKAAGVTITGVSSISASGGGYGYAVPMAANGTTGSNPQAIPTDPSTGTGSGAGGQTPEPVSSVPTTVDFAMSVTVAYSISG